jgi:hypothetical protein
MDDREQLRGFRFNLPERWASAGLAAVACLGVAVGMTVFGPFGGPGTSGAGADHQRTAYITGEALLAFPQDTPSDVVSYADQVSVVTAVSARELPNDAAPQEAAAGDGMIDRMVTFRIDQTLWHRDGRPALTGTLDAREFGWMLHNFQRTRFKTEGSPWIDVGSRYIMPLAKDSGQWGAIMPAAVFPYTSSGVGVQPEATQNTPLARTVARPTLAQVSTAFAQAKPDPAASKHFDLAPTARLKAVMAGQGNPGF